MTKDEYLKRRGGLIRKFKEQKCMNHDVGRSKFKKNLFEDLNLTIHPETIRWYGQMKGRGEMESINLERMLETAKELGVEIIDVSHLPIEDRKCYMTDKHGNKVELTDEVIDQIFDGSCENCKAYGIDCYKCKNGDMWE